MMFVLPNVPFAVPGIEMNKKVRKQRWSDHFFHNSKKEQ